MKLRGCIVALVTPFKNGAVDFDKLGALVDFHIKQGTDWISPCGTTGESPTLSHEEHEEVIKYVVRHARGRIPVLAGTGSNSTAEALRLTRCADKAGADAALMVTPYYNKPEPEGMYQHFKAVADEVKLPIVLYNVPSRTGRSLDAKTVARLAKDCKNIVAIKEASGNLDLVSEIITSCNITVLSGDDSLTLPIMSVGGAGIVSVVANIVPRDVKRMVDAFARGRVTEAQRWHRKLFPLSRAMFLETNPIPIKTAMRLLGRLNGEMRLPLSAMTAEKEKLLVAEMKKYGLL